MKLEIKSKEAFVLACALWAMLMIALFSPAAMQLFHSAVRLLTEGNSYAKSVLFVGFLAACLTIRAFFGNVDLGTRGKHVRSAFIVIVVISMAWGLLLQMLFLNLYGSNVNSFISHVTDCGNSWCWEGNYLQHNHVAKTALFFVEKYAGVRLGSQVDTGQPMYEIVPWADAVAPVTLLLLVLVASSGFISALKEKDALNTLLFGAVAALFTVATIDGGLLAQTGISAVTLLIVYAWRGKKEASTEERFAVPLALGAFVGFLPNLFLGSFMYYRDWFPAAIVASAFFAFVDAEKGWKRITLLGVLVFSLMFFSSQVFEKTYGSSVNIYRTSNYVDGLPGAPNLVIYGLPLHVTKNEVESLIPEINFTSSAKYGWYFVGSVNASEPVRATTLQLQERLGRAYKGGYLYVDENRDAYEFRQVYINWNKLPEKAPNYNDLFSIKVLKVEEKSGYTLLTGISAGAGPALGLEVGSYVKSIGGDATIITLTV